MISPGSIEDAGAVAELVGTVFPEQVRTTSSFRHWFETTPSRARLRCWKAMDGGVLVGWAFARLDWWSTTETDAFVGVQVHHDYRGHGIGTALLTEVDGHLATIGALTVRANGDSGESTTAFARRNGFRRTATNQVLVLDPTTLSEPDDPVDGIEIGPYSSYSARRPELFEVDYATMQDEPGDHNFAGFTFEAWEQDTFGNPTFDGELSTIVSVDGAIVGTSIVYADRSTGRASNGGTGVLRAYRGRGLGLALKRHGLAVAGRVGIACVFTMNDETNGPMLAINRRLGYMPFAGRTSWRRDPTARVTSGP